MQLLITYLRTIKSISMEPKNRPVLVIGFLGIFVSILFTPIIFGRFLPLRLLRRKEQAGFGYLRECFALFPSTSP